MFTCFKDFLKIIEAAQKGWQWVGLALCAAPHCRWPQVAKKVWQLVAFE